MIVDAHHHIWQVGRGDYGWLKPDLPICRDYGLDDLRPLLGEVDTTMLVQAAPTEAETDFLLAVARANPLVRGVVGWMDLAAPDAAARIAARTPDPLLKGLRPMLHDIADRNWIIRPAVQPALAAMALAGLRLDVLARPMHLPLLTTVAARHPTLRCVLDHAGKPEIAAGQFVVWAHDISILARETDWCCKLSGLVTEAGPDWRADDLRRYVDHLLDRFGPDRLMWGSDWPVVTLAATYATWRDTARALVPVEMHHAVFGGTAARFYGF